MAISMALHRLLDKAVGGAAVDMYQLESHRQMACLPVMLASFGSPKAGIVDVAMDSNTGVVAVVRMESLLVVTARCKRI